MKNFYIGKEINRKEDDTQLNDKYLAMDAVPVVDGDVCWKLSLDVPGKSSSQIYKEMLSFYNTLTRGKDMLERSKIALVNENEHKIAVVMQEWLVFSHTFISLDRAELNYVLQTVCLKTVGTSISTPLPTRITSRLLLRTIGRAAVSTRTLKKCSRIHLQSLALSQKQTVVFTIPLAAATQLHPCQTNDAYR